MIISSIQKVDIHSVGSKVQLVFYEVVDLFGYVGYWVHLFQISETRKKRTEKNIRIDRIIAIECLWVYRYLLF